MWQPLCFSCRLSGFLHGCSLHTLWSNSVVPLLLSCASLHKMKPWTLPGTHSILNPLIMFFLSIFLIKLKAGCIFLLLWKKGYCREHFLQRRMSSLMSLCQRNAHCQYFQHLFSCETPSGALVGVVWIFSSQYPVISRYPVRCWVGHFQNSAGSDWLFVHVSMTRHTCFVVFWHLLNLFI